jgi:mannose-6-phosphate isomerase-like protein (cupin superfamily)
MQNGSPQYLPKQAGLDPYQTGRTRRSPTLAVMADGLDVRRLPIVEAPIPHGGGRILSTNGELAQILNGEEFRFLAFIEFLPDSPRLRGNHYHSQRTETLYVLTGRLLSRFRDLETGEIHDYELTRGDLVNIPARWAHAYRPLEPSSAVEMSSNVYDPTDTTPHDLALTGP